MYDFIINAPPQSSTILFGQPWDTFIPPFAGSLLGVGSAFSLNWLAKKRSEFRSKQYYIKLLRAELEGNWLSEYIQVAINDPIYDEWIASQMNNVPLEMETERWYSFLNSGALKLFKAEEANELCEIFNEIKMQNYKQRLFRELIDEYHRTENEKEKIAALMKDFKWLNDGRLKSLSEKIRELLNKEWFQEHGGEGWWQFWK